MLLWPLSLLMQAVTAFRRALYLNGRLASFRPGVPVVVVGNLYVGGTGKTPLVIWLCDALKRAGYRPGVVSRGYGASGIAAPGAGPMPVRADSLSARAGDEPVLIALRTGVPVMIHPRRALAAAALLHAHPEIDVIVSDDGLQHYALARDIEIVLFDERGIGNGWLLPAGPLRESPRRARNFTVFNAAVLPPGVPSDALRMQLAGSVAVQLANPDRTIPLADLAGRTRIAAAAGIGNPQRFFATLRNSGIAASELPLPDHYDYAANPFTELDAEIILITEKDAVKCRQHPALRHDPRLWYVPVAAEIDAALERRLLEKLRGLATA